MLNPQSRSLNILLAALPVDEYQRIAGTLTPCVLRAHQTLMRRGEPVQKVYFPNRSLCSLVFTMTDGTAAEVAVVGAEGLVGVEAVLGLTAATCEVTVQIAGDGDGHAMSMEAFRRELDRRGAFHAHVTTYTHALLGSLMQSVACNGLHSAEARCCRWLLHAHDRLAIDELPLTHDLLSTMLGVRRPTVTLILADLARLGILCTSRGVIQISQRAALEARSCECYRIVKVLYNNLLKGLCDNRLSSETSTLPVHGGQLWREPVALTT